MKEQNNRIENTINNNKEIIIEELKDDIQAGEIRINELREEVQKIIEEE